MFLNLYMVFLYLEMDVKLSTRTSEKPKKQSLGGRFGHKNSYGIGAETIAFSPDEHRWHTAHNMNKKFMNNNFENVNKKF